MEKKNIVDDFTFFFVTMGPLPLFFLFLCTSFNWYNSDNPKPAQITMLVNLVGLVSLNAWLYGLTTRAAQKLAKKNIQLPFFEYYHWAFIIMLACIAIMFFVGGVVGSSGSMGHVEYHFSYSQPLALSLVVLCLYFYVMYTAALSLVSLEAGRLLTFKEAVNTLLLFVFIWIGIWFIQPRVKKILTE